jgi:hypothetical protein
MKSTVRNLRIHTFRALLAVRQYQCESIVREFEAANLADKQRAVLAHCWAYSRQESHVLQLMIDLLERQVREQKVAL